MARVLGPNNVPITAAVGGAPTRASGENFGAQVGAAQQQFGGALQAVGKVGQALDERREKAAEGAFLDAADLELDMAYGRISQEEETKATSGAEGMTQTVRSRFESETDPIIESLREKGFRPSEEAVAKARSIASHRQQQHLKRTIVYENNERVRHFGKQLDGTLATIAQNGVQSGSIDGAIARAEQSIEAHRGLLPAAQLDQMRLVAAKHFFDQTMTSGDPEAVQGLMEKLSRGKPQTTEEGQPTAAAKSISSAGLAAIKREEGYAPVAKWDIRQNSVGYGTKGTRGERITKEEAERRLTVETGKVSQFINDNVTVPLNQGQHDALVSFGFNLGTDDIEKLLPDINAGRFDRVAERMTQFNKALNEESGRLEPLDGLTKRRQSEAQMFLGGGAAPVSDTIGGAFAGMLREKAPQIQKAVDEVREKRADAQRANLILSGQLLVDPGSKDDKAIIDKAFGASGLADHLGQSDPTAAAAVTSLAKKTGYVPEAAMSQLRAMSVNGDPQQKAYAYEVAANLMREKPGIFEGGSNVKELKADATLYETYTTDMGLSSETAIARIGELRTPEFEKRREAVKKDLESNSSVMKQVTGDDLTKEFDGWFGFNAPALGGSPGQAGVIVDTYRDLVKDNYVKTGDLEVAKAMAKKDLLRTYAVSEATGKKRLMRNRPEDYYPAIEPRAGKDPDHSYFTDQLKDSVRQVAGKAVPIGDIYIEPVPQTNSDIRAQRYPGYGVVWFEERDGVRVMQSAPGMVFRADVKAEQERVKANTAQRIRDDQRREIERREAIENSTPRKAFKAGKAMIQNLINPPGGGPAYSDTQTQPDGAVAF